MQKNRTLGFEDLWNIFSSSNFLFFHVCSATKNVQNAMAPQGNSKEQNLAFKIFSIDPQNSCAKNGTRGLENLWRIFSSYNFLLFDLWSAKKYAKCCGATRYPKETKFGIHNILHRSSKIACGKKDTQIRGSMEDSFLLKFSVH